METPDRQRWNPAQYAEQARFVSELGDGVLALLAPQPGEHVLDLGCGDGALTRALADLGCEVVGVDASLEMVAAARELGLEAHVIDGHALPFADAFDAVFSNAALHWMTRPEAVLAGVRRALRPGGRFVGEFGGEGNVAVIVGALEAALRERDIDPAPLNPWYFPSVDAYRALLERHDFQVTVAEAFPRPTPLPNDVTGWLETFAQAYLGALPQLSRKILLDDVAERCRPLLCDRNGRWIADYTRLRFAATRQ
ncbi:MAG: methyltransferase domain-containing protein [Ectothiorhodospiraceae bacterium]|nr:methyltransferase domain-containing protein [Ectothiorhodospiraceae bacterium]MCH8503281.1 methyltransferase domain-containing protein [Ectothiorhodospiraceae bacterium]